MPVNAPVHELPGGSHCSPASTVPSPHSAPGIVVVVEVVVVLVVVTGTVLVVVVPGGCVVVVVGCGAVPQPDCATIDTTVPLQVFGRRPASASSLTTCVAQETHSP
jgi:hypothetical protein